MKITHITHNLDGGVATVAKTINEAFDGSQIISYIPPDATHQKIPFLSKFGSLLLKLMRYTPAFLRAFIQEKGDILHFHSAFTPHILPLLLPLKKPTVLQSHGACNPAMLCENSFIKKES